MGATTENTRAASPGHKPLALEGGAVVVVVLVVVGVIVVVGVLVVVGVSKDREGSISQVRQVKLYTYATYVNMYATKDREGSISLVRQAMLYTYATYVNLHATYVNMCATEMQSYLCCRWGIPGTGPLADWF